ncbi:MAG: primosomal protein N' [Deltaproteobacteria bacterium]|nr:MAG: primosomal protein N' [Deltaproteobacteria bacterium]
MGANSYLVEVAIPVPLDRYFTYLVPEPMSESIQLGQLVDVPFGRSNKRGIIVGFCNEEPEGVELRPLLSLVERRPLLSKALIDTLDWASRYYMAPPGEMFFAALPPLFRKVRRPTAHPHRLMVRPGDDLSSEELEKLRRRAPLQARLLSLLMQEPNAQSVAQLESRLKGARAALQGLARKGFVEIFTQALDFSPEHSCMPSSKREIHLTADQKNALEHVDRARAEGSGIVLLRGVTGSGKTEVYLRAIEKTIRGGAGAILMVPEISLTPQLESRVRERLGNRVAVLHSDLSERQRAWEWMRLWRGEARVALGPRSAVFAPVNPLGLIVVDEEHDSSYKQSERLPYNGRDLAIVRARYEKAAVVLGSATPSLEAHWLVARNKGSLAELTERPGGRPLPEIEIIDLKNELTDDVEREHVIGTRLAQGLAEVLDRKEQAILFLNRRGFASFALCKACGQSLQCVNCSVALVYHRHNGRLSCHYCGHEERPPEKCPHCGSMRMRLFGLGTEKCEQEVRRRFPGARVLRMDADTTAGRGSIQKILSSFARAEADILVGTQMVTKGHDIPGVTLVGVVLADLTLNLPDFRAAERTFQHIVQVAGRAGRGDRPGRVFVQTFLPDHPAIRMASSHALEKFIDHEMERRRSLGYPPAKRVMMVRVSHPDRRSALEAAQRIAAGFRKESCSLQVLGPVSSPIAKIRNRYRFQVMVKFDSANKLLSCSKRVRQALRTDGRIKILFDMDPYDML